MNKDYAQSIIGNDGTHYEVVVKHQRFDYSKHSSQVIKTDSKGTATIIAGNDPDTTTSADPIIEGAKAVSIHVDGTISIGITSNQSIYMAVSEENKIFKVNSDGTISMITGDGTCAFSGDGSPAKSAGICNPTNLAVGADDSIHFIDQKGTLVRKIDPSGMISTIAGQRPGSTEGVDPKAILTRLEEISSLAYGPDGSVYFSQRYGGIRHIMPDGTIKTLLPYDGEYRFTVTQDGDVLVAGGNQILRPSAEGTMTLIKQAQNQNQCCGNKIGIRDRATLSLLPWVNDITFGPDQSTFMLSEDKRWIKKISPKGVVSTFAGSNPAKEVLNAGDGGPATKAEFYTPRSLAIARDQTLYIADYGKSEIRKIDKKGIISTLIYETADGEPPISSPQYIRLGPKDEIYLLDSTWQLSSYGERHSAR